jgi:hypothetical protein
MRDLQSGAAIPIQGRVLVLFRNRLGGPWEGLAGGR